MIKTGGENVARCELEEVAYELDGVAEVAVFGIPHPRAGVEAVVALVVSPAGTSIDERTARALPVASARSTSWSPTLSPEEPGGKIVARATRAARRAGRRRHRLTWPSRPPTVT